MGESTDERTESPLSRELDDCFEALPQIVFKVMVVIFGIPTTAVFLFFLSVWLADIATRLTSPAG